MAYYKSMQDCAKDAINAQNACNSSGLAHTLVKVFEFLGTTGVNGTAERNQHPIVKLYLYKMLDLSCSIVATDDFSAAYRECVKLAEGQ